jgi:hypothetical protein
VGGTTLVPEQNCQEEGPDIDRYHNGDDNINNGDDDYSNDDGDFITKRT